jgi:RNA polymerase sigma factor (sigma-70 family)
MPAESPNPPLTRTQGITAVVRDLGSRLYGFIRRRVANDEDAQDVLQDVWQQLIAQPEIDAITQLSAWLHEVARNKIVDRSRKQREALVSDIAPEDDDGESLALENFLVAEDTPEGQYMNRLFWDELSDALETLPPEQRHVFVENELEGRPLRELAAETGENIKTIISRKGYAVRTLRKRLARLHQEFFDNPEPSP